MTGWFRSSLGIDQHRRLLGFVTGKGGGGARRSSTWFLQRYLVASEVLVGRWGRPWMRLRICGAAVGVWCLVFLWLVPMAVGAIILARNFARGFPAVVSPTTTTVPRAPAPEGTSAQRARLPGSL